MLKERKSAVLGILAAFIANLVFFVIPIRSEEEAVRDIKDIGNIQSVVTTPCVLHFVTKRSNGERVDIFCGVIYDPTVVMVKRKKEFDVYIVSNKEGLISEYGRFNKDAVFVSKCGQSNNNIRHSVYQVVYQNAGKEIMVSKSCDVDKKGNIINPQPTGPLMQKNNLIRLVEDVHTACDNLFLTASLFNQIDAKVIEKESHPDVKLYENKRLQKFRALTK